MDGNGLHPLNAVPQDEMKCRRRVAVVKICLEDMTVICCMGGEDSIAVVCALSRTLSSVLAVAGCESNVPFGHCQERG